MDKIFGVFKYKEIPIFINNGNEGKILISTKFYFNGTDSESMGVYLIRTQNNMISLPFVPAREIKEEYPTNARQPYHFAVQNQCPTIVMTFSTLTNNMDADTLKDIATWLLADEYREFYSEDNSDKIYYLMATGETNFITNANNEGYIEVRYRSKFPYALTTASTPTFTINGTGSFSIDCECNAFEHYFPEVEITVSTTPTTVTFTNTTDSNRFTSIGGLTVGEVVYLNNNKKQMISSLSNYLYDDFNKNWIRLLYGTNTFDVVGRCTITFRVQYPVFT